MPYQPTYASLSQHPVPDWFHDAKLGIFVHWGLYSVPAWAPTVGEVHKVVKEKGWRYWFAHNAYAEWYLNTLRIADSPTAQRHRELYGDADYDGFVPAFNDAVASWDPAAMAEAFSRAGARYVVLVTKHHDGFTLWPSEHANPHRGPYAADRDIVGVLTGAVRQQGLRMGLYYSGGLDWTFTSKPIRGLPGLVRGIPQSRAYADYATAHWRELVARYQPDVLWNDIGYPRRADLHALMADYYNEHPQGVVNDRFRQWVPFRKTHKDFTTPEYQVYDEIVEAKWEATRGIGFSFGYNQNEGPDKLISERDLIHSFADIVSKNGNLLLNVGPKANGALPDGQADRLRALGDWLRVNGDAIYGTRPWTQAEGTTANGAQVRYTHRDGAVYAIVLAEASVGDLTLRGLRPRAGAVIRFAGQEGALSWEAQGQDVRIALPPELPSGPAFALAIEGGVTPA